MQRLFLVPAISAALLAACSAAPPDPIVPPPPEPPSATASAPVAPPPRVVDLRTTGIDPQAMDTSANPCADFYSFACGSIVKNAVIPPEQSAWGPTQQLQLDIETFLRKTLEGAAKASNGDPAREKLGAWFAACTDEAAIEAIGTKPLKPLFDAIGKVHDKKTLAAAIIDLQKANLSPLFSAGSQQDFKDASLMIAGLDQAGLGLPDRDYYFDNDEHTKQLREAYRKHVARMFELAGDKDAAAKEHADEVMRVETAVAKLSQDKVVRRDPHKIYHKVDRKGLAEAAPGFPWDAYWKALGFADLKDISVNSVEYFKGIDALMGQEKPAAWRSYLRWTVLSSEASRLGKAFVDESFAMRKQLTGQTEDEPRWKRCVRSTDAALGEILAQEFVKERFDAASKADASSLVKQIKAAMKTELGALAWMDPPTRAAAEDKLGKMEDQIGYPAKWKQYDFPVSAKDYLANAMASDAYELQRQLKKVGKPVDRDDWQMTPPTVNAYYDSSLNEMVFLAGILQPPFYDKKFLPAVNYGSIGGVMGHELTHGFDDQGAQFDGSGNLRNWWSESTEKLFKEQTKCVSTQYSQYEAVPGVKLNGDLTLGENIADIGGVKLALTAFHDAAKRESEKVVAGGFNEDQLFFIAYGQSWCEKDRPEILELMAKTNPHSPARYRVNGVLANVPQFADTFSCKIGSPMRPEKTCSVW